MYLHEDRELFADIIAVTSEKTGVAEDIVEKDYYVTIILKELSESGYPVCFKGGTSLSKAYGVIDRFSEDIDIAFTEHLGESRKKKLKYEILKAMADKLGLRIDNWLTIESDRDYNHYDLAYDSVVEFPRLSTYVKLETALMSYAFPTVKREIDNYIHNALKEDESDLIEKYSLQPFLMEVQTMERTLIDKIFAVCDYYILGRSARNSRHLYDIYKLSQNVVIDEEFRKLVEQVRTHRLDMKGNIAPAAAPNVDMVAVIKQFCEENFYSEDYEKTTRNLTRDDVSYDQAIKNVIEVAEKIFYMRNS